MKHLSVTGYDVSYFNTLIMRRILASLAIVCLLTVSHAAETDQNHLYWEDEGRDWVSGVCATGTQQSPIDIDTDDTTKLDDDEGFDIQLNLIDFSGANYQFQTVFEVITRVGYVGTAGGAGHMVAPRGGTNTAYTFELDSFHFHTQSEHTVDGDRYDMEAHIVFEQNPETLTRYGSDIAVFFKKGKENAFLKNMLDNSAVDWSLLFPSTLMTDYLYYDGSSTAFACEETITYYIWNEVQEASSEQIKIISGQVDAAGNKVDPWGPSYRTTYPLNGRKVWRWGDLEDLEDFAGVLLATVAILFL